MTAYVGYQTPNQAFGGKPQQHEAGMFEAPIPVPATTNPNWQHGSLHPSMSFDPSQSPEGGISKALIAFDPYASGSTATTASMTTNATPQSQYPFAATTVYNNYAPYGVPPSYSNEEMTTLPPAMNPFDSIVSDITVPAFAPTTEDVFAPVAADAPAPFDAIEQATTPEIVPAEEPKVKTIKNQQKHQALLPHTDKNQCSSRTLVNPRSTHNGKLVYGGHTRNKAKARSLSPLRTPRGQENSIAHGGVAVLDPKKDLRKQTRELKTSAGAIGGAVAGGLVLGPIGAVLGACAGGTVANKIAKSRDKRKQAEFEQKNFQKHASKSHAAKKGASCYV